MVKTKVRFVCGEKESAEFRSWSKWLKKAGVLFDRYIDCVDDDDPFAYNETASVAFLASAAALAGHSALAEYSVTKIEAAKADRRKLKDRERHGRGDLWLHADGEFWAFEFKQRNSVGLSRANGRLESLFKEAENCATQVNRKREGIPVAGLIVSLFFIRDAKHQTEPDRVAEAAAVEIERFARKVNLFCWKIEPPEGRRPTYLLFKALH